ncbi:MAG: hypothetical protein V8S96_04275 [Lachnospiraceae bacterium]
MVDAPKALAAAWISRERIKGAVTEAAKGLYDSGAVGARTHSAHRVCVRFIGSCNGGSAENCSSLRSGKPFAGDAVSEFEAWKKQRSCEQYAAK